VQKQILAVDPDQPVYRVRTMLELMSNSLARRRLSMLFLAIFACAALALASVGIYGITSYSVAQRAQEMGVRMALGASRAGILRLVLGQSLAIALAGVEPPVQRKSFRPLDLHGRRRRPHRRHNVSQLHPRLESHTSRPHGRLALRITRTAGPGLPAR
jgi:hypothetical protein